MKVITRLALLVCLLAAVCYASGPLPEKPNPGEELFRAEQVSGLSLRDDRGQFYGILERLELGLLRVCQNGRVLLLICAGLTLQVPANRLDLGIPGTERHRIQRVLGGLGGNFGLQLRDAVLFRHSELVVVGIVRKDKTASMPHEVLTNCKRRLAAYISLASGGERKRK